MDSANKDEGVKCLNIAEQAYRQQNIEKAQRFAEKASRLLPTEQVAPLLEKLGSFQNTGRQDSSSNQEFFGSSQEDTQNLRQRKAHSEQQSTKDTSLNQSQSKVTSEQRETVIRIIRAKDYYEILQVEKECTDDQLKKSYRKLALKLHPDKNKAPGAEDAFKKVSKAFQCLSDPDKKDYYNRYGYEDRNSHMASRSQQQTTFSSNDMDAQDLFNMMFGGADPFEQFFGQSGVRMGQGFGARQHVHRAQRQGAFGAQQGQETTPQRGLLTLVQIVPLLLFLMISLFSTFGGFSEQSDYSLQRSRYYNSPIKTQNKEIDYFVQSFDKFNNKYQLGSRQRSRLERDVEQDYKQYLIVQCQREIQERHLQFSYSYRKNQAPLKYCEELKRNYEEYKNI